MKIVKDYIPKQNLNKKFWQKDKLNQEVRKKLLEIANFFINSLDFDIDVLDIHFTGSLANYNWNAASDIDLHIIVDYNKIGDYNLVLDYFKTKKDEWDINQDVQIYGFSVEIFVEDLKAFEEKDWNAVYSLETDQWIREPKKENVKLDYDLIKRKVRSFNNMINNLDPETSSLEQAKRVKDKIMKYRTAGLEKKGELANENIVFKVLRRLDKINDLKEIIAQIKDRKLSLD